MYFYTLGTGLESIESDITWLLSTCADDTNGGYKIRISILLSLFRADKFGPVWTGLSRSEPIENYAFDIATEFSTPPPKYLILLLTVRENNWFLYWLTTRIHCSRH